MTEQAVPVVSGNTPRWRKVLEPDQLPDGRVTTITVDERTYAASHVDGAYGLLDNRCPHQGGPLGEGSIEKGWLRCCTDRPDTAGYLAQPSRWVAERLHRPA